VLLVTKRYVIALLSTKPVLVETYLFLFLLCYLLSEHCIGAFHCLFRECFNAIWLACFRNIWKERNNRLFDRKDSSSYLILDLMKIQVWWWIKARFKSFSFDLRHWWFYPLLSLILFIVLIHPSLYFLLFSFFFHYL